MNSEQNELILFTNSFPFGLKETYLETEIEYLCKYFEKVNIFPLYYNNKDKSARKVPGNAIINLPPIPTSRFKRIWKFGIAIIKSTPVNQFIREFFKFRVYSSVSILKRWLFDLIDYSIVSKSSQINDLKKKNNSIFYYYWGTGWSYSLNYLNKNPSNKYFVRIHGGEAFLERNHGYIPLRKQVFENADMILTISNLLRTYIHDTYLIEYKKLRLSRLGTNYFGVKPTGNSSVITVVTVANLIKLKRIDLLISILKKITDKKIEWYHFGDGPEESIILMRAKNELPPNINLKYSKRIKNIDLLHFYSEVPIDCFINLSVYEGLPVSIMEAMSFGIPVIATSAGATNEIVNNSSGLLIPIDFDLSEVRSAILNLKSKEWIEKGHFAKIKWEEEYMSQKNYIQLIRILKS